jgi:5'-nucleotidase
MMFEAFCESKRPLILVCNDDGIDSPGLRAAAETVSAIGEVLIVAPNTKQTGMGRSFPRSEGHGVIEMRRGLLGLEVVPYYAVFGSPAQAVAHAVLEIATRRPALCVSGINDGENLGATNFISGTVGCACEAAAFGIPALGISVGPESPELFGRPYDRDDWAVIAHILQHFACGVINDGLPPGVDFLNINIPWSASPETEIRITAQSRQNQYVCGRPEPRDFSKPSRLPIIEQVDFNILEPASDIYAFCIDKVVSVTPMVCDMTARDSTGAPVQIRFANDRARLMEDAFAD